MASPVGQPNLQFAGHAGSPGMPRGHSNQAAVGMPAYASRPPTQLPMPNRFNSLGQTTAYGRQNIPEEDRAKAFLNPFSGAAPGSPGGSTMQTGGGITAGLQPQQSNQARGFINSVPFGMSTAAQGTLATHGQDLERSGRMIEDTDLQRRAAFEQARQDMTRQVGQAESNVGMGNLLQRFREGDQSLLEGQRGLQRDQEAFIYDLIGGMFPR